jgi:hypothetical protein
MVLEFGVKLPPRERQLLIKTSLRFMGAFLFLLRRSILSLVYAFISIPIFSAGISPWMKRAA